jgi:hypothetical protein
MAKNFKVFLNLKMSASAGSDITVVFGSLFILNGFLFQTVLLTPTSLRAQIRL